MCKTWCRLTIRIEDFVAYREEKQVVVLGKVINSSCPRIVHCSCPNGCYLQQFSVIKGEQGR